MSEADAESLRDEVAMLRRTLARERARRAAAESVGEQVTSELYRSVEELRANQEELMRSADRARIVQQLMRRIRLAHDSSAMRASAAREIGRRLDVDRCVVVVLAPELTGVRWSTDGAPAELSGPPYDDPTIVEAQLRSLGGSGALVIHDTRAESEDWPDLDQQSQVLGVRSSVIAPMLAGSHLVGALVIASLEEREWDADTVAICEETALELGHLLVHLSSQEQEVQLRQLQELDRTKDEFVSNVSHELRTPLASITGYLELLQEGELGKLPDTADHALDVVARNADRLRSLVEDLLTFSAHSAGETRLDQVSVDLRRLVVECCQTIAPWTRARGVEVDLVCTEALPKVWADGPQLRRAVHRVISNAVKFTPPGGRVDVSVDLDGGVLRIRVADTGEGIASEELDLVFTPFFRSSRSVREEMPGTGLGLPLVKAVVDLHGGSVRLDSEEGAGTVVTITLPVGPLSTQSTQGPQLLS